MIIEFLFRKPRRIGDHNPEPPPAYFFIDTSRVVHATPNYIAYLAVNEACGILNCRPIDLHLQMAWQQ